MVRSLRASWALVCLLLMALLAGCNAGDSALTRLDMPELRGGQRLCSATPVGLAPRRPNPLGWSRPGAGLRMVLDYLLTGRRRSEVLNLRWRDLDLQRGFSAT